MGDIFIILSFFNEEHSFHKPEESMSYKFRSNARTFEIEFEVTDIVKGFFPHIGITAREGICVMYKHSNDSNWYNIDCFLSDSPIQIDMTEFISNDESYEIIIYCPIICKFTKLDVIIPDEYHAEIVKNKSNRNIVVMGGPITYGIGCTTVNNMFSNILERKFNAHVDHLAYDTDNYLEAINYYNTHYTPPVADVGIIELDYYSQHESSVESLLPEVISSMKQRCRYLIGWYCIPEAKSFKKTIANNIIREFINNKDLEIIDLSYIHDEKHREMCVYNPMYINDTGNILIYKKLKENIRRLTKWNI